jgi:hypothetical protein
MILMAILEFSVKVISAFEPYPMFHPIFVAWLQQPFESSLHAAQVPSRLSKSPIVAILERRRVAAMNSFQCNQTLPILSFLF